jgi:selenoprotein W-related protein
LAAELKQALPGQIKNVELIPSSGGVFEIRRGKDLVYSKRQLGRFPEEGEVVRLLKQN